MADMAVDLRFLRVVLFGKRYYIKIQQIEGTGFTLQEKIGSGENGSIYNTCRINDEEACYVVKIGHVDGREIEMYQYAARKNIGPVVEEVIDVDLYIKVKNPDGSMAFELSAISDDVQKPGRAKAKYTHCIQCIFMEKFKGTLSSYYIEQKKKTNISVLAELLRDLYERQLAANFVHGDLHAANIVLEAVDGGDTSCSLIDFSFSYVSTPESRAKKTIALDWLLQLSWSFFTERPSSKAGILHFLYEEAPFDNETMFEFWQQLLVDYASHDSDFMDSPENSTVAFPSIDEVYEIAIPDDLRSRILLPTKMTTPNPKRKRKQQTPKFEPAETWIIIE